MWRHLKLAITSAPVITLANKDSYALSGTCSENGNIVAVVVGGLTAQEASCASGQWSLSSVVLPDLTSVNEGETIQVTATHRDNALNSTDDHEISR